MPAPTTARLRHDIHRARGDDKVDAMDLAAAPLGTDDEAAGAPPSPAAIKGAYEHEIGASLVSSEGATGDHAVAIYVSIVVSAALLVSLAIWLV